jgi:hypothetical protein
MRLSVTGTIAMEAGSGSSNEFASDYAACDTLDLRVFAFGSGSDDLAPYLLSITEDCPIVEDGIEDSFEDNNDRFNLPLPGIAVPFDDTLNFCSGDEVLEEDWFAIEVDEGCTIVAQTTSDDATRRVITDTFNSIHASDDSGPLLDSALIATNTGTHKVGVFGTMGVGHDYDLLIELDCPAGECVDDEWALNGDGVSNDDQATATPITQSWDAEICGPTKTGTRCPLRAAASSVLKFRTTSSTAASPSSCSTAPPAAAAM